MRRRYQPISSLGKDMKSGQGKGGNVKEKEEERYMKKLSKRDKLNAKDAKIEAKRYRKRKY
jgi:hypothetical protein